MIARIVSNQWIYFDNITPWEEEQLVERFSAQSPNARYIDTTVYQSWDGVYRKYSKKYRRLARPFLAELRLFCMRKDLPLTVKDERAQPKYTLMPKEQVTEDLLPNITFKQFQVDSIKKIYSTECGIFSITTGGGKCVTAESKIMLNGVEMEIAALFTDLDSEEIKDIADFDLFVHGPNGPVRIEKLYKTNKRPIYKIWLSSGHSLRGVFGHRVYTRNGWKRLGELRVGNDIQVYAKHCIGDSSRRIYSTQKEKAVWEEEKRSTPTSILYKLFVFPMRREIREDNTQLYGVCGEGISGDLQQMYIIEGRKTTDKIESRELPGRMGEIQTIPNERQSDEFGEYEKKSSADLSEPLWACCSGGFTVSGQITGTGEMQSNERKERNATGCGCSREKISGDYGKEECYRIGSDQSGKSRHLEEKSQYARIDKRVIFKSSEDQNSPCNYEVWKAGLSESTGACIHQMVRKVEEYIESKQGTDDPLRKFVVFIGFPSTDTSPDTDCGNKVSILIRDEEGRDITEEIGCGGLCKSEIDEISLARAEEFKRVGFPVSDNWANVISICEDGSENCYDLQVNCESHAYWVNGVLSHNTEMMAAICKVTPCPTAIIAEQIVVIEQIKSRLELREVCEEAGLFYAGKTPTDQVIIVGSIQSLVIPKKPNKPTQDKYKDTKSSTATQKYKLAMKRYKSSLKAYKTRSKKAKILHKLIGACDMLLVDECDLAVGKTYQNLFRYWFKGRRRYGFTGTPYDDDKPVQRLTLQEHLGSVIYEQKLHDVEATGLIVPLEYYMVVVGEDGQKNDAMAYDIALDEFMIYSEEFHGLVAGICSRYSDDGTLILVERHDLGHALKALIPDSQFVYGLTPKKQRPGMLREFEARSKKVLIGGKNVRRGLDLGGGCENLVLATGGKLTSEFDQRIGRARRRNEQGKARVFDFLFLCNKYLYAHSRRRLKAAVEMGYKTRVIFKDGVVDGADFVRSRFKKPKRFGADRRPRRSRAKQV